jgi:hypothetical protein
VSPYTKQCLEAFCRSISPLPTILVKVQPEPTAKRLYCLHNVWKKVKEAGGSPVLGWEFSDKGSCLLARHHVVWQSPEGHFLDITPDDTPGITEEGRLVFLPDPAIEIFADRRGHLLAPPNKYFPVSKVKSVCKAISRMQAAELADWRQARPVTGIRLTGIAFEGKVV